MISLKLILGFLILIFFLHTLAILNYWYWIYPWLDMLMHFLGGFLVAMIALVLILYFKFPILKEILKKKKISFFITILFFVFFVGIFWEFFDFFYNILISNRGYSEFLQFNTTDTINDLFFDLLGGVAFLIIYRLFFIRFNDDKGKFL